MVLFTPVRRALIAGLALTAATAGPVKSALATTVANAAFNGSMTIIAGPHDKTLTLSKAGTFNLREASKLGSDAGSIRFSVAPAPGVAVTVTGMGAGKLQGSAAATMIYDYQVVGPKSVAVPIIATATGTITGSTSKLTAGAVAEVVSNLGETKFPISASCPTAYPPDGAVKYVVLCGAYHNVASLKATASTKASQAAANEILLLASGAGTGVGGAGASIAVSLSIDPSFANASEYSIIVSKGLTNP